MWVEWVLGASVVWGWLVKRDNGSFMIPEADVRRLKAASMKSQRTIINQVAAAVESSPYWSALLIEYLASAPAMLERGPQVVAFLKELSTMKVGPGDFKTLLSMLQQLPVLQMQLRKGSCDGLVEALQATLSSLWSSLHDGPGKTLSSQALQELLLVYEEAVVVFPTQVSLQNDLNEVRMAIQQQAKASLVTDVLDAMKMVGTRGWDDLKTYMEDLAMLKGKLHTNKVDTKELPDGSVQVITDTLQGLKDFVCASWTPDSQCMQEVSESIAVACSLAGLLSDKASSHLTDYLSKVMQMVGAQDDVDNADKDQEVSGVLEKVVALQRKIMAVVETEGKLETSKDDPCYMLAKKYKPVAEKVFARAQESLVRTSYSDLEGASKTLAVELKAREVAFAIFDETTWSEVLKKFESTCMNMDNKGFVAKIDTLQQAWASLS